MRILDLPPVLAVRRSFRTKLLLSLLGSIAVLMLIPLLVVRQETARGIAQATADAEYRSREEFNRLEAQNRQQLSQISSVFTGSMHASAALEAALEGGDAQMLARDVDYQFAATRIPRSLLAFTDAYGDPLLAMLRDSILTGADPVGIGILAQGVLETGEMARTYRVVNGVLYSIETLPLELGRPIGTVTVGVAISDTQATELASIIGAEVCFVVEGRCVAGTPRTRQDLRRAVIAAAAGETSLMGDVGGEPWRIIAEPMTEDIPVARVIAVPLNGVLAPFHRMQRALLLGGIAALILAAVLASVLSRNLTRPVRALVGAAARIGAGDFGAEVDVSSVDEMGVLGRAFNDMARGLALKERYRGVLDKVVSPEIAEELLKGDVVLGGEKREVTTVFADIVGFTRLTDGMEPMHVIAMLNECMERLTAVIEAEGGVVDKYVGDEIMAIFGAPVARGDDVLRAARAALGMQAAMGELNRARAVRGEAPLEVSIGMSTGAVMAGNMGSANRLNYTVIGDAVNLAARVEHAAAGGQILMTEATAARIRDHVVARDTGLHELRGFAQPVRLYELAGMEDAGSRFAPKDAVRVVTALVLGLLLRAAPGSAQRLPDLPTLENVRIASAGGWFQMGFSGRLDLEGYWPADAPAWIIPTTEPFVAPRLRVFADAFFGERVVTSAELRVDRGEEPAAQSMEVRLDQLFARVSVLPGLALQAGRFVSPFGGYGLRHHTPADALIRPPLPYDYRTVLSAGQAPGSTEGFLTWRDDPDMWRPWGAPVIWGAPYQWGAMALGAVGPVSWRAALMNSAPSSEPEEWGLERGFGNPSVVAHVGVQVAPSLDVGVSFNNGAWMRENAVGLPLYGYVYDQRIWGAEASFAFGRTKLRGEAFHDTWQVPNVAYDAVDVSWYVEAEQDVATGITLAARYGAIHFRALGEAAPHDVPWDYDVNRLQLGAGYRLARNLGARVEAALNGMSGPRDPADNLFSAQLWWTF